MPSTGPSSLSVRPPAYAERLRPILRRLVWVATIRMRRAYYMQTPGWSALLAHLPARLRARAGLADASAIGSRRIELGSGPYPQTGYIHVDGDWHSAHLEYIASASHLPFDDGFADELVAVHLLEHIHPNELNSVLREWLRVLRCGGLLQVHVPDTAALTNAFLAAPPAAKWPFIGAILGMYSSPDASGPQDIVTRADHQLLLDFPLVQAVLADAGFVDIEDVSSTVSDRHTQGWAPIMDQVSLVVRALKPEPSTQDARSGTRSSPAPESARSSR
jgi:SAM-dependent methyltransferase